MLSDREKDAIFNWGGPQDTLLEDAMLAVKSHWHDDHELMAFIATLVHRIARLEEHTSIPRRNAFQYDRLDSAIAEQASGSE